MELERLARVFFLLAMLRAFNSIDSSMAQNSHHRDHHIDVGVILDMESPVGEMAQQCMTMAISDLNASPSHTNHHPKLILHPRNSMGQPLKALSSAVELLENEQVEALIGPQTSEEAELLAELGNRVPIISFSASSPFLSVDKNPNFIRMTTNDISQVGAIAALVQEFGWRELVIIHEDSSYGNGIIPDLLLALDEGNACVAHRTVVPPQARDIYVEAQLYKLMAVSANVFIVHMSASLTSRFFLKVNELGMMSTGYGWIVTDGIVNELPVMDQSVLDSMQGVIGIRPHIPPSKRLYDFSLKWRNDFFTNQHHQIPEVNVYCLWAYDSVWALAKAAYHLGPITSMQKNDSAIKLAHLAAIPSRPTGSDLVRNILGGKFMGLSGEIRLKNGQLQQPLAFEIVNVAQRVKRIGFWTQSNGITTRLNRSSVATQSTSIKEKGFILWPGSSLAIPKGQQVMAKAGKRLRIVVPNRKGFKELVGVELDPKTNATTITGFCIEVFKAAIDLLPYEVKFDFIPMSLAESSYDDMIYQVYLQQYDAAVGDITIKANRSLYVDFTMPFTQAGVGIIVPIETTRSKSMWIFLQPLKVDLWLAIGAFFVFTGWVVWTIEHNDNSEFKGPLAQQIGTVMWYSFSTLVFPQWEKLISNLSKVVVTVWLFVVLILSSNYIANLSSMLTVDQLQSLPKSKSVGFPFNSAVKQTVLNLSSKETPFPLLQTVEDYANALRDGSWNGGVSAIVDEIPYVKLFLSKYSAQYSMVEPSYSYNSPNGFGFAFPKGSPLVPDISASIAKLREDGRLYLIGQNWFQSHSLFTNQDSSTKVARLDLYSFRGLFLITGITSTVAVIASYKLTKTKSTVQQHEVADQPVEEKFSPVSHIPSRRTSSKHIRRYSY